MTRHPALTDLLELLHEPVLCGGSYVAPENRLLFQSLACMVRAQRILETGYDTGCTTAAFAMTGAEVIAIDNHAELSDLKNLARQRVAAYPNVTLVTCDALRYLIECVDHRFQLVFIDDCHWPAYVAYEILEAQRIVEPGGIIAFHDTLSFPLEEVIRATFPPSWDRIQLPCIQSWDKYSGDIETLGYDFGIMLVRKPYNGVYTPIPPLTATEQDAYQLFTELIRADAMTAIYAGERAGLGIDYTQDGLSYRCTSDDVLAMIPGCLHFLRVARTHPPENMIEAHMLDCHRKLVNAYGLSMSAMATQLAKSRRAQHLFGEQRLAVTAVTSTDTVHPLVRAPLACSEAGMNGQKI